MFNPQRACAAGVMVVVPSVCVRVCVTANQGIYADRCQMMGTSGISGVWRSLKKMFSLKMRSLKVTVSFAYRGRPQRHSSALELAFSTEYSKVV